MLFLITDLYPSLYDLLSYTKKQLLAFNVKKTIYLTHFFAPQTANTNAVVKYVNQACSQKKKKEKQHGEKSPKSVNSH